MEKFFYLAMFNFATTVLFAILYFKARRKVAILEAEVKERKEVNRGLINELKNQVRENELQANPIFQALKTKNEPSQIRVYSK